MRTRKGKRLRTYITATDPKTKKSVSVTLPGERDEVLEKIETLFASRPESSEKPEPANA